MKNITLKKINKIVHNKVIAEGGNSKIYLKGDNAFKLFDYIYCENFNYKIQVLENKRIKLKLLKKLSLPFYVDIKELYSCKIKNNNVLCAYEMPYLISIF